MKKITLSIWTFLLLVMCINLSAQNEIDPYSVDPNPAPHIPGYKLVWSDEFNYEGTPDPDVWGYETGFQRNNEHQWYQGENATCADGALHITAKRETGRLNPNYEAGSNDWKKSRQYIDYTSASINTSGKKSWQYGRFEIRAKLPIYTGAWPAIWTLGTSGEWPSNGEIDIMEYYDNSILANAAWGSSVRWQAHWKSSKTPMSHFTAQDPDWANKYHIWTMDWTPEYIKLYVDGELLNSIDLSTTVNDSDGQNPFKKAHYVLLNLAIGGDNGGDPTKPPYPITYYVDYVRVYQQEAEYYGCFEPLNYEENLAPDPTFSTRSLMGGSGSRGLVSGSSAFCGYWSGYVQNGGIYQQNLEWEANTTYRVRAVVRTNGEDATLGITGLTEESDYIYPITGFQDIWKQVDFTFQTPAMLAGDGGIYYTASQRSFIDNLEIYKITEPYIYLSETALSFNQTDTGQSFRISGALLSENIELVAPQGIELNIYSITPEQAGENIEIKAVFDGKTIVENDEILILYGDATESIRVNTFIQDENGSIIPYWDGYGATGAGSEPDNFGWIANGGNWEIANAGSGVRYQDKNPGEYTLNGEEWSGRVLPVRWESGVSPGNCFALPVNLSGGKIYYFSGIYGWNSNGDDETATFTIGINDDRENNGTSLASQSHTVAKADAGKKIFPAEFSFNPVTGGTYYLTITNNSAIMGIVGDLAIIEKGSLNCYPEITLSETSLIFNLSNPVQTFTLSGRDICSDIKLTAPQGISLAQTIVSPEEAMAGIEITATYDQLSPVSEKEILIETRGASASLAVSATLTTGIQDVIQDNELIISSGNGNITAEFRLAADSRVNWQLYNATGMLVASQYKEYTAGTNREVFEWNIANGIYILKMNAGKVLIRKIVQ